MVLGLEAASVDRHIAGGYLHGSVILVRFSFSLHTILLHTILCVLWSIDPRVYSNWTGGCNSTAAAVSCRLGYIRCDWCNVRVRAIHRMYRHHISCALLVAECIVKQRCVASISVAEVTGHLVQVGHATMVSGRSEH